MRECRKSGRASVGQLLDQVPDLVQMSKGTLKAHSIGRDFVDNLEVPLLVLRGRGLLGAGLVVGVLFLELHGTAVHASSAFVNERVKGFD